MLHRGFSCRDCRKKRQKLWPEAVSFTIVLRMRAKLCPLIRGASRTYRCGKPPMSLMTKQIISILSPHNQHVEYFHLQNQNLIEVSAYYAMVQIVQD